MVCEVVLNASWLQGVCYLHAQEYVTMFNWSSSSPAEFGGWYVFDPAIAAWLLDSEHPVRSFSNLLATHGLALDTGVSEGLGGVVWQHLLGGDVYWGRVHCVV